jgi:uncharacterized protein
MTEISLFLALSFMVGIIGGLLGIGGAIIIVPILVSFFAWPEKVAQGTALAMLLPPVSVLAVWEYYKAEQIRIGPAILLIACFIPGSYLGGNLAQVLPAAQLTKFFGAFAMLLAVGMIRPRVDRNVSGKKDQQT